MSMPIAEISIGFTVLFALAGLLLAFRLPAQERYQRPTTRLTRAALISHLALLLALAIWPAAWLLLWLL